MNEQRYLQSNQMLWDEWADIHAQSPWYDLDAIRAGECRLRDYELEEVGNVKGKTLLHLMCQIGTDTVCWAREGASAVGVDFSPRAVSVANDLASELKVDASFVCADVLKLPDVLPPRPFDIVYTSRGILRWLPDLNRWAEIVAQYLAPGGFFYMAEVHPIAKALSVRAEDTEPRVGGPYFERAEPLALPVKGSYAEPDASVQSTAKYLWPHSMGEVLTALAAAGLCLEYLHERPWADRPFPFLKERGDRTWVFPDDAAGELPLFFTLKATQR